MKRLLVLLALFGSVFAFPVINVVIPEEKAKIIEPTSCFSVGLVRLDAVDMPSSDVFKAEEYWSENKPSFSSLFPRAFVEKQGCKWFNTIKNECEVN